ncbi:MAG: DJ-1/PfpI family protein [Ruminococcaceae bacterium]|nr:DJ-1/PfpI family protein [Oscillospiraceae bacterium]
MIYIFLANGFEETEALVPLDILRRAKVEVKTVGIGGKTIVGSHGISVNCDTVSKDLSFNDLKGIVLPGGLPGATNIEADSTVQNAIAYCAKNGLLISAICAAPQILGHKDLLNGKNAVCFPGFEKELKGAKIQNQKVVRDGNFITAWGAGAAFEFGFEILCYLTNSDTAKSMRESMKY